MTDSSITGQSCIPVRDQGAATGSVPQSNHSPSCTDAMAGGGFSHLHSPHSLSHLSPGRGDTSTAVDEGTGVTGLAGRGLHEKRLQQHLRIDVAFWGGSHGKKGAAPRSDIPSGAARPAEAVVEVGENQSA